LSSEERVEAVKLNRPEYAEKEKVCMSLQPVESVR